MNKIRSALLAVTLACCLVMAVFVVPGSASDNPSDSLGESGNTQAQPVNDTFQSNDILSVLGIQLLVGITEVENGQKITSGTNVTLVVKWEITEENFQGLKAGDQLVIPLEREGFSFSNTAVLSSVTGDGGEIWGQFGIQDGNIVFNLSEQALKHNALQNGVFRFQGSVYSVNEETEISIQVGTHTIDAIAIPRESTIPEGDYPYGKYPRTPKHFEKTGSDGGSGMIKWRVDFNYDNALDIAKGNSKMSLYNVFLEDEAEDGHSFSKYSVSIASRIYRPVDETGAPSNYLAGSYTINSYNVSQQAGESNETFRERVRNISFPGMSAAAYGVTLDGKHLYVNLGNIPSEIAAFNEGDGLITALGNSTLTEKEKETLINTWSGTAVAALSVSFSSIVDDLDATYSNVATISWKEGDSERDHQLETDVCRVYVQGQSGSATPLTKHDVQVEKLDADTKEPIEGASFMLRQKQEEQILWRSLGDVYLDTSFTGTTDSQGKLVFRDLKEGEYQLVETGAADGYEPGSATYSPSEYFSIPGSEDGTVIQVYNKRIDEPKPDAYESVWVTKQDAGTKEPIEGARFKLQKKDPDNIYQDTGSQGVTDSHGQFILYSLEEGEYRLVETQAAEGYDLESAVYYPGDEFAYSPTRDGIELLVTNTKNTLPEPEPQMTGSLVATKTDRETGAPIPGAAFQLQQRDSRGSYLDTGLTGITGESGTVLFQELKPGDYRLVETSAAEGYDLDSAQYSPGDTFAIGEDEPVTVEIGVTNDKLPQKEDKDKDDKDGEDDKDGGDGDGEDKDDENKEEDKGGGGSSDRGRSGGTKTIEGVIQQPRTSGSGDMTVQPGERPEKEPSQEEPPEEKENSGNAEGTVNLYNPETGGAMQVGFAGVTAVAALAAAYGLYRKHNKDS